MLRQRSGEQRTPNSVTQTFLSTDVLCCFFCLCHCISALMVSVATANAAVNQVSEASPVTSAQIQPSMDKTVMKVTAKLSPIAAQVGLFEFCI